MFWVLFLFLASIANIPFEMINVSVMMFVKCYIVADKKCLYGGKINWNVIRDIQINSKSNHVTIRKFGSIGVLK